MIVTVLNNHSLSKDSLHSTFDSEKRLIEQFDIAGQVLRVDLIVEYKPRAASL
jgi:hypothetical protein